MSTFILGLEPAIPVCEELLLVQEELSDPLHQLGADVLWTPAEELRVTLLQLEDVDRDLVRLLLEDVRLVAQTEPELEIAVKGICLRPDEERPRLLLAEVEETDGLRRIRDRIGAAAGKLGLPVAADWLPWIRVGRLKTSPGFMPLRGLLRGGLGVVGPGRSRELVVWELLRRDSPPWTRVLARAALGTGG